MTRKGNQQNLKSLPIQMLFFWDSFKMDFATKTITANPTTHKKRHVIESTTI